MNKLSYDNWYELRNLVLEASWSKKLTTLSFKGYEPIIKLVQNYLETGDKNILDTAAEQVAELCPSATNEGKKTPWLLLEKS